MTFEEWITQTYSANSLDAWTVSDLEAAWDAAYHQAIQDIIDYAEHMGDVEKFARQHGIRVEEE